MKTICIFSGYYLPHLGGVERYTYNLANEFNKMGDKVIIVTLRYNKLLKEIEETEVAKIYRLPTFNLFVNRYPIIKNNKKCKEILKKIEEENIDSIILQTRFWTSSYIGAKFANKNKIPVCLIEHGSTHFTVNNRLLDFFGEKYEHLLTNFIKRDVKDFYGVSKKCTEWLKHFNIEAKGIFYNSINVEEAEKYKSYIKKQNNKIIITYVGRIIKEKGILKLINIFNKLKDRYYIELNIAGDGELYERIKEENKENENIKIWGNLAHEDVMKLLAITDIFVNPSSFPEGLPTSILEAGIMKCAIVATPMGGTQEIIENDSIGIICGWEENEILQAIKKILDNKELEKMMGENIYKKVRDEFSWNVLASKIKESIKYKEN